MSTAQAASPTHLYEWLHTQPGLHEPYIHVETPAWGKELPFDGCTACFRSVVEAS
jgi:hypothetical protein